MKRMPPWFKLLIVCLACARISVSSGGTGLNEDFNSPLFPDNWEEIDGSAGAGVSVSNGAATLVDGGGLLSVSNLPSKFDLHCRIAFFGATNDALELVIGADMNGPTRAAGTYSVRVSPKFFPSLLVSGPEGALLSSTNYPITSGTYTDFRLVDDQTNLWVSITHLWRANLRLPSPGAAASGRRLLIRNQPRSTTAPGETNLVGMDFLHVATLAQWRYAPALGFTCFVDSPTVTVQTSTDLKHWSSTLGGALNRTLFTDTTVTNGAPMRFYRITPF